MIKCLNILVIILLFTTCVESQNSEIIGGSCEGCEAIYDYNGTLKSSVTLPEYNVGNQKIKISGVVYNIDGKTPAKDVILYVYQTNAYGKYPKRESSAGWEAKHGYLRAWVKTDTNGKYEFYTTRPASYPNSTIPQHIHIVIKEPNKMEYYVEDFFFADDPNLTANIVNRKKPRGGSGVISLKSNGQLKEGNRMIILGKNIPNY